MSPCASAADSKGIPANWLAAAPGVAYSLVVEAQSLACPGVYINATCVCWNTGFPSDRPRTFVNAFWKKSRIPADRSNRM